MPLLIEAAPAKVNLFLHVIGRRADGYHLLDSVAVFGPARDELRATADAALTLACEGPFATALAAEADNLVWRAARLLDPARGAALTLVKRLPVASGIGGGSADAAAALRLLDRLWGLRRDASALLALAARLGADVPVCLASRPARMQGVGEVLRPAPALPECGLLLVHPGVALPTPAVFAARAGAAFSPPAALPLAWPDAVAMARDLRRLANDLEAPAIALCPPIAETLAAIAATPGCLLARMSGSGATCFGLYATPPAAAAAARHLPAGWWREGGGLYAAAGGSLQGAAAGAGA